RLLLLGHEDHAEAPFADLLQQLVRPDDRARAFAHWFVPHEFWLVRPAEKVSGVPMSAQQLLDAGTQGSVGPTHLIEKANQLVGLFAVQSFEKDRLGIGLYVAHA